MICEECKAKIHTFKFNMDEYVYKKGEKYFCGWHCLRKWERENRYQYLPYMEWQKTSQTKWMAMGNAGIFFIERIDGGYKASYNSSTYNTKIKFKKTRTLDESKSACEDNEYWEW